MQGEDIISSLELTVSKRRYEREIENEIEQDFVNTLKNSVINPYDKNIVIFGEKFMFIYVGARRYERKRMIRFTFVVSNYKRFIGKVYVDIPIEK